MFTVYGLPLAQQIAHLFTHPHQLLIAATILQTYTHLHVCVIINGAPCCPPAVSDQSIQHCVCVLFFGSIRYKEDCVWFTSSFHLNIVPALFDNFLFQCFFLICFYYFSNSNLFLYNSQASRRVDDLFEDLRDGHNLLSLLEVLSGEHLVSSTSYNIIKTNYTVNYHHHYFFPTAKREGQNALPYVAECSNGARLFALQENQTGQHSRRGHRRRQSEADARPDLDHHSALPGKSFKSIYNEFGQTRQSCCHANSMVANTTPTT